LRKRPRLHAAGSSSTLLPQERTGGLSAAVADVTLATFNRWMFHNVVAVATLKQSLQNRCGGGPSAAAGGFVK
jgi:hypothetical protein